MPKDGPSHAKDKNYRPPGIRGIQSKSKHGNRDTLVDGELPERYLVCIDEYLKGKSKTDAMLKAGYSEGTARGRGPMLVFGREDVKAEMARRQKDTRRRSNISQDWVLEKLKGIVDAPEILAPFVVLTPDGKLDYDFTDASPEQLRVINSIQTSVEMVGRGQDKKPVKKFKITTGDRQAALTLISRIMGYHKDVEVKGEITLVERLQAGRKRTRKDAKAD